MSKGYIEKLLEDNYLGIRQRKNKANIIRNLVIVNMNLKDDYKQLLKEMSFETFHEAIMKYKNWDREWQDVTLKRPDLRGSDYDEKEQIIKPYKQKYS